MQLLKIIGTIMGLIILQAFQATSEFIMIQFITCIAMPLHLFKCIINYMTNNTVPINLLWLYSSNLSRMLLNLKHLAFKLHIFEDIDLLTYVITKLRQVNLPSSDLKLPQGPGYRRHIYVHYTGRLEYAALWNINKWIMIINTVKPLYDTNSYNDIRDTEGILWVFCNKIALDWCFFSLLFLYSYEMHFQ